MGVPVNLAPLPKLQFSYNGAPISGGQLFTYISGTTTKLATFTTSAGTTMNRNPIILDSNGECDCWLQAGSKYTFILSPSTDSDPPSNAYWTVNNITGINDVSAQSQVTASGSGVVLQTGDIKRFGAAAGSLASGWLLCTGAPVSRTTYSALYARIGTQFGAGDGSTTFNLPDYRGRVDVAPDAMGGTAANRLTVFSATLGAAGGDQNLAQHDHQITDVQHSHSIINQNTNDNTVALFKSGGGVAAGASFFEVNVALTVQPAYTGITSTENAGSGVMANVQPTIVTNIAIWSGPDITVASVPGAGVVISDGTTLTAQATLPQSLGGTGAATLLAALNTLAAALPTSLPASGNLWVNPANQHAIQLAP